MNFKKYVVSVVCVLTAAFAFAGNALTDDQTSLYTVLMTCKMQGIKASSSECMSFMVSNVYWQEFVERVEADELNDTDNEIAEIIEDRLDAEMASAIDALSADEKTQLESDVQKNIKLVASLKAIKDVDALILKQTDFAKLNENLQVVLEELEMRSFEISKDVINAEKMHESTVVSLLLIRSLFEARLSE